jgi:probable F420-dependent oxidoreductase
MFEVFASTDQRLSPEAIGDHARRAESMGFDGINVPEAVHDGLVMSTLALAATMRLRVATSVLVAFPRSPMVVANAAWDLQAMSDGRFELGLGPQVRGNIVRRYSAAWSPPVARMREFIESLRAIFASFQEGAALDYRGEHYQFTSLQPFFNPGPLACGPPPIQLGVVGERMTEVAGQVADGLVIHPTAASPRVIRERTLPRLERSAKSAGRSLDAFALLVGPLVATGPDEAAASERRASHRELLGFLFSTPAYAGSLEVLGYPELGASLHELSRAGKWGEMSAQIDDALVAALVPCAPYAEIADVLRDWYGNLAARLTLPLPDDPAEDAQMRELVSSLHSA